VTDARVSLAIPTYRREEVLVDTIRQALALDPAAHEILVIDQSERHLPETDAFLRETDASGRIRWLRQSPPNLPAARNRALREATGEVVIFVDDDVRFGPDLAAAHARGFADPSVAAVTGRVRQANGWQTPTPPARWPRRLDFRFFRPDRTEPLRGVATLQGGNHSIRREVALALGGYDERFAGWAFREESDMALRLWNEGRLIVFEPAAELLHLQAMTGGCRYEENDRPVADWTIAFPGCYFAFKHLFPRAEFWSEVATVVFPQSVLRMRNARRPWRLPFAAAAFAYAFARAAGAAWKQARSGKSK
jgi:GT2 family glycosyltransferase